MNMASVAPVHRRERPAQAVRIAGRQDQVNMVWHEHPCPGRSICGSAVFREQVAIERVINIAEEGLRLAVAALLSP